ncbi:Ig-like domain-containing protein [Pyxidicoccus sp. MSG2]|uniref:Ig-like domain-containing protein n=1 Tax=Pyxidicoccus sp. MSG2 TaxID=2996790 RepID=UPI00226E0E7E|nr:Ig-like domain-containing protein [Pyxidicoccus sp. MSG2]MCY1018159.1 Ig-like domain-containing protein [Pyxidicoccus sp. MSG2]
MHVVKSKQFVSLWLLTLVALGAGCGSEQGGAQPEPHALGEARQEVVEWTGSFSPGRWNHTATRLADGRVLVAGGETSTSNYSSAQLYNPATGTWTATGSMNAARTMHCAVLLDDGRVLVMGGNSNGTTNLASAELYNPATGTWTLTGSLYQRRRYHAAVKLNNGKVLVVGGLYNVNDTYLASAELYDPATGTWTFLSPGLSATRMGASAILLPDGRVAVLGGQAYSGTTDVSTQVELFNPATNTFSSGGSLNQRRYEAGFVGLPDGRILGAGGWGYLSSAEIYNPATQTSQPINPMAQVRDSPALVALDSTRILAVSGSFSGSPPYRTPSIEAYDTTTGTWSTFGSLHTARSGHTATLLTGTPLRVLVAGGSTDSTDLNRAEVIKDGPDTTPPTCTMLSPSAGNTLKQTYTLAVSASDNVDVTSVQLYVDGALLGTAARPYPLSDPNFYSLSWNTTSVANGAHTVSATARDAAGYVTSTGSVSFTVDNDLTPPTVSFTSPTAGTVLSLTATLTATASDNVGLARVEFYQGTTLLGSDAYAPYSLSWDTTLVANGAYTLTAKAVDTTGNVTQSSSVAVTVANETVPPTVAITAPAPGAVLLGTVTLTADATDNVGVTRVELYRGSTLIATDYTAPYSVTWDTRTVANGAYALTAKAYDAARNTTTSAAVNVTLNNDLTPPTTSVTAPSAGASLSGSVTVSASASDNVAVARVELYRDTTLLGSVGTAPYSVTWDTTSVANGSYTLTSKAIDTSGNTTTSAGIAVTVDNDFVVNGGFEGSSSPWTLTGQAFWRNGGSSPHGGSGNLELGPLSAGSSGSAEQSFTLPAGRAATLSFWLYITSGESSLPIDSLAVEIVSSSGALTKLQGFSNLQKGTGYVQYSYSLASYAGQTVRLRFRATKSGWSSLITVFRVDDVSVK